LSSVESFGETHALAQAVEDVNATFVESGDYQVKTVRAEIDRRDGRGSGHGSRGARRLRLGAVRRERLVVHVASAVKVSRT
jgi:hypothetical protein